MSKLLGEFLKEQQEPFALEVYLLEKGCLRRSTSLNSLSSAKVLNKSASSGVKKRKYVIPSCSKYVKSVFNRLVSSDNSEKITNSRNADRSEVSKGEEETAEDEKFSTTSSTGVFNSCSKSDSHPSLKRGYFLSEKEVTADRKLKWRAMEDNKQQSPVSVLDETESESDDASPIQCKQYNGNSNTTQGESSTSFPPCKFKKPTHYSVQELQELIGSKSSSQYIKNKRALRQTKQLLFDCVREVVENHRKRDRTGENLKKILGPEELWNTLCENVWLWSQESINDANIINLLDFDFLASAHEWGDFEQQKKDISMEFEDEIFEDVLNEIVENFVI